MGSKTQNKGEKTALITGITGQDGAYLARLLLQKGYRLHGVRRRSSSNNTERIASHETMAGKGNPRLILHYADLADASSLLRLIREIEPDEIYNLGAQSHVQVSFETAEYTGDINSLGVTRLLEAIRTMGLDSKTRFYQASTSEMYGAVAETPQSEMTPFQPCSPYAAAKLSAFWMVSTYRQAYGLHASNGILFNHESPLRGDAFVTRKISRGVAAIANGSCDRLYLGNLDAERDWGHARDYVEGMWLMLQQAFPDDYVLATGISTSVRQFVHWAFEEAGITLDWRGDGIGERAFEAGTDRCLVEVDPNLFRPAEVHKLQGDARKARERLGWVPTVGVRELIGEMVQADLKRVSSTPSELV